MAVNPASYESWKRRRLAAGAPLSAIEAMRPTPSPQRQAAAPGYIPPSQPFDYPSSPQASAPGEGFAPPGTSMSLKNDTMLFGETLPGIQGQGFLPQAVGGKPTSPFGNTPGIFQGGSSPFTPTGPATRSPMPGIPPGALANTPGFDSRFKPKAPLWR